MNEKFQCHHLGFFFLNEFFICHFDYSDGSITFSVRKKTILGFDIECTMSYDVVINYC